MKRAFVYRPRSFLAILVIIGLFVLIYAGNLRAEKMPVTPNSGSKIQTGESDIESRSLASTKSVSQPTQPGSGGGRFTPSTLSTIWTALIFVLALILVAAWLIRKAYPGGNLLFGTLPVLQVLGRTHLGPRQTLAMIRLDNKLVLLGITDHQINPILTIDDPEEVSRLVSVIEQSRPASITSGFRGLFSREAREIQQQQAGLEEISTNSSSISTENEVLQLKSELNSLINKVQKFKGIGGQNFSS